MTFRTLSIILLFAILAAACTSPTDTPVQQPVQPPAQQQPQLRNVTVTFVSAYNPMSSNECSAEVYFVVWANGQNRTVWREMTDADRSTFEDCNESRTIDVTLSAGNLSSNGNLEVFVEAFEKDGDYHRASTYRRVFANGSWLNAAGQRITGASQREPNEWGDQDFEITYVINVS